MDLRLNEIVLEFGHDWVNIVTIRSWLSQYCQYQVMTESILSISGHDWVNIVNIRSWLSQYCHYQVVTEINLLNLPWLGLDLFFSLHASNKMTHSSCKKLHTLRFDTLLMLKMIHSVVWHALDTRNGTLCFYDTLMMLKMTHSVLWHTLDNKKWHRLFFQCRQTVSYRMWWSSRDLVKIYCLSYLSCY